MITSKRELKFYLMADSMMNIGKFEYSFIERIKRIIVPNDILNFMKSLRYYEYYKNVGSIKRFYWKLKNKRIQLKLGFSIAPNVLGYGVVIPHWGTIVVGYGNHIGNYSVLHTSTCITAGKKEIGDAFYCSAGTKVINDIVIGKNVSASVNSVVNKNIEVDNVLIVGSPATIKKQTEPWYVRDGKEYLEKVENCEKLKEKFGIL